MLQHRFQQRGAKNKRQQPKIGFLPVNGFEVQPPGECIVIKNILSMETKFTGKKARQHAKRQKKTPPK